MTTIAWFAVIIFLFALIATSFKEEVVGDLSVARSVLLFFTAFMVLIWGVEIGESAGHKQGQIDALTGKVKYKLEKQSDSTVKWVEINPSN